MLLTHQVVQDVGNCGLVKNTTKTSSFLELLSHPHYIQAALHKKHSLILSSLSSGHDLRHDLGIPSPLIFSLAGFAPNGGALVLKKSVKIKETDIDEVGKTVWIKHVKDGNWGFNSSEARGNEGTAGKRIWSWRTLGWRPRKLMREDCHTALVLPVKTKALSLGNVRSGIQGDQNADVLDILEALEYGGDIIVEPVPEESSVNIYHMVELVERWYIQGFGRRGVAKLMIGIRNSELMNELCEPRRHVDQQGQLLRGDFYSALKCLCTPNNIPPRLVVAVAAGSGHRSRWVRLRRMPWRSMSRGSTYLHTNSEPRVVGGGRDLMHGPFNNLARLLILPSTYLRGDQGHRYFQAFYCNQAAALAIPRLDGAHQLVHQCFRPEKVLLHAMLQVPTLFPHHPAVTLPLILPRPQFSSVSADALVACSPELSAIPVEFICEELGGRAPQMLAGIQALALSHLPLKSHQPTELRVPLLSSCTPPI
ncbi:hypothetical protein B0H13DRAFT_1856467 [Mycena leptocephala]|nr:hypothetical protein B0H13DRAFT_1856467 [Mycena leptocephala]